MTDIQPAHLATFHLCDPDSVLVLCSVLLQGFFPNIPAHWVGGTSSQQGNTTYSMADASTLEFEAAEAVATAARTAGQRPPTSLGSSGRLGARQMAQFKSLQRLEAQLGAGQGVARALLQGGRSRGSLGARPASPGTPPAAPRSPFGAAATHKPASRKAWQDLTSKQVECPLGCIEI